MFHSGKTKGMVLLLLLLGAAAVNAAPTISNADEHTFLFSTSLDLNIYPHHEHENNRFTGLYNSRLDSISMEFHKPPVTNDEIPDVPIGVKSLPPAPKTLLMVMVGFLCVSLVKDRRIWLASVAGLLWAGQAGVSLLPQLAANVAGKGRSENKTTADNIDNVNEDKKLYRLRSDIEGSCYIGLLRHLEGIPDRIALLIPDSTAGQTHQTGTGRISHSFSQPRSLSNNNKYNKESRYCRKASSFAFAAIPYYLSQIEQRLASYAGHHVIHSSELIIATLARGPPDMK